MASGKRYVIGSVRDFLDVPADCRAQCLSEFEGWLAHVEEDVHRNMPHEIGPFIWTDDGVMGVRVEPRVLERESLIVGPGYLDANPNDTTPRFRDLSVAEQHRRMR